MWLRRSAAFSFVALLLASKWGNLPHPDPWELQGAWEIVMIERHGADDSLSVGHHLTFIGNEVRFSERPWPEPAPESVPEGTTVQLDPAAMEERTRRAALS
jgi:hypothetical protein